MSRKTGRRLSMACDSLSVNEVGVWAAAGHPHWQTPASAGPERQKAAGPKPADVLVLMEDEGGVEHKKSCSSMVLRETGSSVVDRSADDAVDFLVNEDEFANLNSKQLFP